MRCQFCHNPDTWIMSKGTEYTADELLNKAIKYRSYWGKEGGITVSGGEPLLQEEIGELLEAMAKEENLRVEIETNGSVPLQPFAEIPNGPSFTMDYKLPGSGMEKYMLPENFAVLRAQDTVKFVVKDYEDLCRARDVIREYDLTEKCHVYLSPVYGQIELENIVNFMKDNRLNDVNMQLQMHKIIWDSEMRGV